MAQPKITISGKLNAPDGTLDEGTISIQLVTNEGAASVTDDTDSAVVYKLTKKPIEAKVLKSTGEVLAKDGAVLQLTPNALIQPLNTHYKVTYTFKTFTWSENWYLDNHDYLIGEITPTNISTSFTQVQSSLVNALSLIDSKLFMYDLVRDKTLSVKERRETFTISGVGQPQQFAYYHGLVSSNSGLFIGRKETLTGIEISAGNVHSAAYSIRLHSDFDNDYVGPWSIVGDNEFARYDLNEDFLPSTQVALFYNPVTGQEVNNGKVTLIFRERV